MPRKNAVLRWLGPKGIHRQTQVACFQATVVDVGVAIISDANGFSAHAHQAFDVMSVLSQLLVPVDLNTMVSPRVGRRKLYVSRSTKR